MNFKKGLVIAYGNLILPPYKIQAHRGTVFLNKLKVFSAVIPKSTGKPEKNPRHDLISKITSKFRNWLLDGGYYYAREHLYQLLEKEIILLGYKLKSERSLMLEFDDGTKIEVLLPVAGEKNPPAPTQLANSFKRDLLATTKEKIPIVLGDGYFITIPNEEVDVLERIISISKSKTPSKNKEYKILKVLGPKEIAEEIVKSPRNLR